MTQQVGHPFAWTVLFLMLFNGTLSLNTSHELNHLPTTSIDERDSPENTTSSEIGNIQHNNKRTMSRPALVFGPGITFIVVFTLLCVLGLTGCCLECVRFCPSRKTGKVLRSSRQQYIYGTQSPQPAVVTLRPIVQPQHQAQQFLPQPITKPHMPQPQYSPTPFVVASSSTSPTRY